MEKNKNNYIILKGIFQKFETRNTVRMYSTEQFLKHLPAKPGSTDHVALYESMYKNHIESNPSMAYYYLQEVIFFRTERIMKKYCS